MPNWFDLPQEIKQTIFQMVSETDSIIYVPRDRRRKVDEQHNAAHHFHDLLTVSKTFITPDEFAFAILGTAKLTFHTYNELRRLLEEVKPAFKQCVRRIHFSRFVIEMNEYGQLLDSLDGFSKVEEALSQMSELKQIYISFDEYCAEVAHNFERRVGLPTADDLTTMVRYILSQSQEGPTPPHLRVYSDRLDQVMAAFVANRNYREVDYAWLRPLPWIRRVVLWAEQADVDVILQTKLCVTNGSYWDSIGMSGGTQTYCDPCWAQCCHSSMRRWGKDRKELTMHIDAEMSTRDWIMRVEYDGRKHHFHQKLAYDMIYAPTGKGASFWRNLLLDLRRSDGVVIPRCAF